MNYQKRMHRNLPVSSSLEQQEERAVPRQISKRTAEHMFVQYNHVRFNWSFPPNPAVAAALVTRSPRRRNVLTKEIVYREFKHGFTSYSTYFYHKVENDYGKKNKRDIYEEYHSIIRQKTDQFKFQNGSSHKNQNKIKVENGKHIQLQCMPIVL